MIPNIIDDSVPIGRDDSENVEVQRFGEPVVPDFEVPYHTEIMERFERHRPGQRPPRSAGNGFYYLMGDIARLHSCGACLRPGLYDRQGLHLLHPALHDPRQRCGGRHESQTDMDAMMYKIEGEDLYLIGTSEHSMIGKFIDTDLARGDSAPDPDQLLPLLPQGEGRPRH